MSASTTRVSRAVARASAVVLIASGLAVALVGPADALDLPDPASSLVGVTTPVSDTLDELTRPVTGAPAPAPAPAPALPATGSPATAPSDTQADEGSSPSARGRAGGDDLVAVDAEVDGLLGLCIRVPGDGGKPRADVLVLDQDLIEQLTAQGVPLREIAEPCPAGQGASAAPAVVTPAGSSPQVESAVPAGGGTRVAAAGLAFTGAEVVQTAVLAVGLLWLGVLLTLASRRLTPARQGV